MPPHSKVTVLYIVSSPHSGSTLLGAALASHPNVTFAGELFEIPYPAWDPGRPCSCGEPAGACPYWNAIRADFERTASVSDLLDGENRYDPWRAILRVGLARRTPSRAFRAHVVRLRSLTRAIASASGRSVVIDSSKQAGRGLAYEAARSDELDVRFLHLVRDGRGVVGSRKSREVRVSATGTFDPNAVLRYSILWVAANLAFLLLFPIQGGRYLRVRYEDFTRDPEGVLTRICRFVELDPAPLIAHYRAQGEFPIIHVVAGNRLRLAGPVRIRPSKPDWEERLDARERRTFAFIAGPMARMLGYRKSEASANPERSN